MEYLIDLQYEDIGYNALIHFVATFRVNNDNEAKDFINELIAGFSRRGVIVFTHTCNRIDLDPVMRERSYEYCKYIQQRATAFIKIEQFFLESPNQTKSLSENLIDNLLNGNDSMANIGKTFNIPVRVSNKKTRNPIQGEFYYFTIEHLIPKK
jgi:hypothetical protein